MKRRFDAKLRKVGNSFVITVPSKTVERFKLKDGDFVTAEVSTDEDKEEVKK